MGRPHILVLGQSGQLAQALARLDGPNVQITCKGREVLDLTQLSELPARLSAFAPSAVINAAAFTSVDDSELETERAFVLNSDAPAAIGRACQSQDIPLVHVSTNYVFDGEKGAPYVETDAKAPINTYGASKSRGEDLVLEASERAAVLRTSAVFGHGGGRNFLSTMLRLAQTQAEVCVVEDELTRPTPASALAETCVTATLALLEREPRACGVFHFAGAEDITWADYAREIFMASAVAGGPTARIVAVSRAEFPQRARRPRDSRLDSSKITQLLDVGPCLWRNSLVRSVTAEFTRKV